jgi:hypothetical protein
MVPIIFGLGLYGTSLNWRRSRMVRLRQDCHDL